MPRITMTTRSSTRVKPPSEFRRAQIRFIIGGLTFRISPGLGGTPTPSRFRHRGDRLERKNRPLTCTDASSAQRSPISHQPHWPHQTLRHESTWGGLALLLNTSTALTTVGASPETSGSAVAVMTVVRGDGLPAGVRANVMLPESFLKRSIIDCTTTPPWKGAIPAAAVFGNENISTIGEFGAYIAPWNTND